MEVSVFLFFLLLMKFLFLFLNASTFFALNFLFSASYYEIFRDLRMPLIFLTQGVNWMRFFIFHTLLIALHYLKGVSVALCLFTSIHRR